jgi:hypothetical protein
MQCSWWPLMGHVPASTAVSDWGGCQLPVPYVSASLTHRSMACRVPSDVVGSRNSCSSSACGAAAASCARHCGGAWNRTADSTSLRAGRVPSRLHGLMARAAWVRPQGSRWRSTFCRGAYPQRRQVLLLVGSARPSWLCSHLQLLHSMYHLCVISCEVVQGGHERCAQGHIMLLLQLSPV